MTIQINTENTAVIGRRKIKALRWWVLALFLLGVTVNYITRNSLGILAAELKTSLGITTEQYSCIVAAFQAAYTLFQPLCGWLIDVIGLKLGFLICARDLGCGVYDARWGRKLDASGNFALLYGERRSGSNTGQRQNHC